MQAAQFQVDNEHAGGRGGADDVIGQFQSIDGGEAAHEADDGALRAVRQHGLAHDLEVEAGSRESGAAGDDQVRDAVAAGVQRPHGLHREMQGVGLIERHAGGGGRKCAAAVETGGVQNRVTWLGAGFEDGVAMVDIGQ